MFSNKPRSAQRTRPSRKDVTTRVKAPVARPTENEMGLPRFGRPRIEASGHVRGELLDHHGRGRRRGNRVKSLRKDFPRQDRHSVLVGSREALQ
eukprot:2285652-Alexandrium_andersonii.AAC.1